LGVDLVPFKSCSYDCIYCQLGRTTKKTVECDEHVAVDAVLAEVRDKLREGPRPDFISLAGSGEPTLNARIGDIVTGIKALTDVPVAVLTNGSLLWRPEIRAALSAADLVMPSLDAGDPSTFQRVNRPHTDISFEQMVDGLLTFSREFRGTVWLEVFLLAGITNRREGVEQIAGIADRMRLDRVQLNTVSRPAADASALTVSREHLEELCSVFSVPCEPISESSPCDHVDCTSSENALARIVSLVSRRPCTVQGIASGLGLHPNEVQKALDVLCAKGAVGSERAAGAVFFKGVLCRTGPESDE
jgi:wyosine [tRNA(Phe)-imidazoG37] synthetase (radical SAM superfamily)